MVSALRGAVVGFGKGFIVGASAGLVNILVKGNKMMVEIASIAMICCLIDALGMTSVIFFGVGIGILGAIDELYYKRSIPIKGWMLLIPEVLSTLGISLSLLNEVPEYMVISLAIGMVLFLTLYNKKKENRMFAIPFLVIALFCINIAFFSALSLSRFIIFMCLSIFVFGTIYYRKTVDPVENK